MTKLLCISAGHGGRDPGAIFNGYTEKDLNLVVAKRVAFLLSDLKPDMIRTDDSYAKTLTARALSIAGRYEYCLDIHFNAAGGRGSGVEAYHSIFSKRGKRLAGEITKELSHATKLPIRNPYPGGRKSIHGNYDYYAMHRLTGSTTTIIVEGLFIDNQLDITRLNVDKIATAIANGFRIHLEKEKGIIFPIGLEPFNHYKISATEVIEVDPMALSIEVVKGPVNNLLFENFVSSGYQASSTSPVSILVSEGKVIHENHRSLNGYNTLLPAGTLIVYKDGTVDVKPILDIKNQKDVWFAVGGCTIMPEIRMTAEGFVNKFSGIARETNRPVIGWNEEKQKVMIAVRPNSSIWRARLTLQNLGCKKGITLDAGGSTVLRIGGKDFFNTTRHLYSVIKFR